MAVEEMKLGRGIKYYLLKFLRLKGAPWKVAAGFALGACINFYPTFGIGVLLAGVLAGLLRVSIPAALLGDIAFKSLFPAFFYLNLVMGNLLLGRDIHHMRRSLAVLTHLTSSNIKIIGQAFFLGALINTLIVGGLLSSLVFLIFSRYKTGLARFVGRFKNQV